MIVQNPMMFLLGIIVVNILCYVCIPRVVDYFIHGAEDKALNDYEK